MSGSNCCPLVCIQVSQETGEVVWYSHFSKNFPQFVVILTVKGFSVISEAEVDVFFFLVFPCFLHDPTNVGNLISGSSASLKPCLYIWKFLVHILLKPFLKDFEHNLTSMQNEGNFLVVWTSFGTAIFGTEMKTAIFQPCSHWWVFQICLHIECSTFTASSFRIWNSSAGIP